MSRFVSLRGTLFLPVALVVLASAASAPSHRATFVVNSDANVADGQEGDGLCDTGTAAEPTGICTLRAAIDESNAAPGADLIQFAIGSGPVVISSFGYQIREPVEIDGRTQPGYQPGGPPLVEVTGVVGQQQFFTGFTVVASGVTIRGLAVTLFTGYGIHLASSNNTVQACYLGVAPDQSDQGNGLAGVYVDGTGGTQAVNNTIGGIEIGEGNSIAGNDQDGVRIEGPGATGTRVLGNHIGIVGVSAVPNTHHGVNINNSSGNTIGSGPNPASGGGNLIGGNGRDGVILQAGASGNVVTNNNIGVAVGPLGAPIPVGNGDDGISFVNADGNTIGANGPGELGNRIGFNGGEGIFSTTPGTNRLFRNAIFQNMRLGIDLGPIGPNTIDQDEADGIPNQPELDGADETSLRGSIHTWGSLPLTIGFYANDQCDPTGFGEGEEHVGDVSGTTDVDGNLAFQLEAPGVDPGRFVSARADSPMGSSEFSNCILVDEPAPPGPLVVNTNDDHDDGVCDSADCSLREALNGANQRPGKDDVLFDLDAAALGIALGSPLPAITDPVRILGASQAGYAGTPLVEIDGTNAGDGDGLTVEAETEIDAIAITKVWGHGVYVSGPGANGTVITRSYFGLGGGTSVGATGLRGLSSQNFRGNMGAGIVGEDAEFRIGSDPTDPDPADGNAFVDNGLSGVVLRSGMASILGNQFRLNAGLAIDLDDDGVTANDGLLDPDAGANDLINQPFVRLSYFGSTHIEGLYEGLVDAELRLEFFASAQCDPSGYGEAEQLLGSSTVTTDGSGNGTFAVTFPDELPAGTPIAATATDAAGHTSEFSECVTVADFVVSASPDSLAFTGQSQGTFDITVAAVGGEFPADVTLSCPNAPSEVTCSFSPATVVPGTGQVTSTLTVTENAAALSLGLGWIWFGLWGIGLLTISLSPVRPASSRRLGLALGGSALAAVLIVGACGGNEPAGPDPNQPVTRSFSVTGTSGGIQRSATVKVTIQ